MVKPQLNVGKLANALPDDTLRFSGGLTLPPGPQISPLLHGLRVQVVDTVGTILDVTLPPGAYDKTTKTGWQVNRTATQFNFKFPGGFQGITSAKLQTDSKRPNGWKVSVQAKNGTFPVLANRLPLEVTVVVDLPVATTGQCGRVTLPAAIAPPGCLFDRTHNSFKCR